MTRAYEVLGGSSENTMRRYNQGSDEEEIMLQYAIRQSLGETNGESNDQVDIWEALEGLPPGHSRAALQGEDRLLQQAIEVTHCTSTLFICFGEIFSVHVFLFGQIIHPVLQASMSDMNGSVPVQQPPSRVAGDGGEERTEDELSLALR